MAMEDVLERVALRAPKPPQTRPIAALDPRLPHVAQPRGGDEQLRLEARGKVSPNGLVALSERAEKLAELHAEGEAVALIEVRDEDIVAARGPTSLSPS